MLPALLCALLAAPDLPLDLYTLHVADGVWDVITEDVNANGRTDIVAMCSDDKSHPVRKYIAIFLQDENGAYPQHPSTMVALPPAASTAFFAEINGDAPRELVVADHTGVDYFQFQNGEYFHTGESRFPSLLPSGSREPLFLRSVAKDLTGDGIDEWLIPTHLGYQIRNAGGLITTIECDIRSEIQRWSTGIIQHRLPAIDTFTLPGETQQGVAILSDDFADFAHGPNWSERTRYRIPVNLDDKWDSTARMRDIDGDGFPDLIVTQTRGTIRLEVQTQIYLSKEPLTYPDEPSITFETSGALTAPYLEDIDGDGKQDLIFASIPFGVRSIVNFFLRSKVTVRAEVHLFENGGFSDRPSFKTSLTIDAPDGRDQIAFTMGDFNGDGFIDAAIGSGSRQLAIHLGNPRSFISSRPEMTLDIPTFGVARTFDLNDNGADDIIIFHPGGEERKRIEVIVF